jgi:hypothetical protein
MKASELVDTWVTRWSKRVGLVLVGWMLANVYHGTQNLEKQAAKLPVVQQQAAVVQKEAACEHNRANKTASIAGQAILSANVDNVPMPQFKDLPTDNCPHPASK